MTKSNQITSSTAPVALRTVRAGKPAIVLVERDELDRVAERVAREMNEEHFESRRGIGTVAPDAPLICWYDNNPYAADIARRPAEHTRVLGLLSQRGIVPVARASYGDYAGTPDDGYTIVYLFANRDGVEDALLAAVDAVLYPRHSLSVVAGGVS